MTKTNESTARGGKGLLRRSRPSNVTSFSAKPKKPSAKMQCNLCDMAFFYEASLAAHQKSHAKINTCQHCYRKFAISTGLFKHLREHCTKISFPERKKLVGKDRTASDLNRTTHKTPIRTTKLYTSCSPSQIDRIKAVRFPPIKGMPHIARKLIKCFSCGEKFKNPSSYAIHVGDCARGQNNF